MRYAKKYNLRTLTGVGKVTRALFKEPWHDFGWIVTTCELSSIHTSRRCSNVKIAGRPARRHVGGIREVRKVLNFAHDHEWKAYVLSATYYSLNMCRRVVIAGKVEKVELLPWNAWESLWTLYESPKVTKNTFTLRVLH